MVASTEEVLLLVGAFQTAWLSLLEDERLETSNIDRLPGLLMSAILESARGGERDEEKLAAAARAFQKDRKSTRLNSSHGYISYAVFCLKKKKKKTQNKHI